MAVVIVGREMLVTVLRASSSRAGAILGQDGRQAEDGPSVRGGRGGLVLLAVRPAAGLDHGLPDLALGRRAEHGQSGVGYVLAAVRMTQTPGPMSG